ncbi:MAG TPA: ATP-binding protein [Spirochaetia bacterium]|nr:ATP-binding protein [Spirochaetia bacterium]
MPAENSYVHVMELLLPPLNSGLLLGGLVLFIYLAVAYRSKLYTAIALLGATAFLFVASDAVIAFWGNWKGGTTVGVEFLRLQQVIGAFFLFTLPHLLGHLLKLGTGWKRLNRVIAISGLGLAAAIAVIAYCAPDLFIAVGSKAYSTVSGRITYLSDREGIVYQVRDLLIGLVVLYALGSIAVDLVRHKRFDLLFISFGILAAVAGAALDILAVWNGGYFGLFADQNFTRFSVGLTVLLLALMSGVVREFVLLSREVHRANERLKLSERKNRILAQGTKDCILSLTDDYTILNANKQALQQLHLRQENLAATNFLDLIASDMGSAPFLINLLKEKIEALKAGGETVFMKLKLKGFLPTESRSYNVSFEYVETEEGNEIIATASQPQADTYLKYIQAESGRFVIDNFLLTVEEISNRLATSLPKFVNDDGVKKMHMGLREMLLNALEHGNLSITSQEKNQALMEDRYFQFMHSRQQMPEHRDKKITVEYSVSQAKAVYRITDQGDGFDSRSFLATLKQAQENLNLQGRGILMALGTFDKITYNDKGNCVTLVKHFT